MTDKAFTISCPNKIQHLEKIKSYIVKIGNNKDHAISYYLTKFFTIEGKKNPAQKTNQYLSHDKVDFWIEKRINSLLV